MGPLRHGARPSSRSRMPPGRGPGVGPPPLEAAAAALLGLAVLWRALAFVSARLGLPGVLRSPPAVASLLLAGGLVVVGGVLAALGRRGRPRGRSSASRGSRVLAPLAPRFLRSPARPSRSGSPDGAATSGWARPGELRPLRVAGPGGGRLVIGRSGRQLLAAEPRQSLIVIGPTQSQKTSGIAVPAILEWDGPVLATSVKTDLVRDTVGWRRSVGDVLVYDPAEVTGMPRAGWCPLDAATTWGGARRVASSLCSVARSGRGGGLEDAGFWYSLAEKMLGPLLFAAASAGASMADVCRWVDTGEMTEVQLALELAGVEEACRAASASFGREERQLGSVYATVESVLAAFSDPSVLASAAVSGEIGPEAMLAGGRSTIYLCAPAHEQERLQPVFVAVVRQLVDAALERSVSRGRPLDPPLLVVLDEAANVAPVADLDRLASTAAGHGVQLVTVFQDMAQIEARYGQRAATVVNNHRAKVVLSGISDPVTLEHMSRLVGEEELWSAAVHVDHEGRWSRTDSAQTRPLAPAASLRRIAPGEGVLIYGHLPPAMISLRPWFAEPSLRRRAQQGADGATSGHGS